MRKKITALCIFTAAAVLVTFPALSQPGGSTPGPVLKRPKLIVGIVVDQMRWDYLYRFYDHYGDGGFKRLLNEGFSCENTFINYLPSYTAVGHTAIFTGSVPAITGITGNNWIDQSTGKSQYCTEDNTAHTIGAEGKAGQMSPRQLLASTITDELRLATNFRSKVVGVSLKDRASILPAGHLANAAFWLDDASGRFITSSYYMKDLPGWVKDFNNERYPEKLLAGDWTTLYPISTYLQSTPDNVPWERTLNGEQSPVFPHKTKTLYQKDRGTIRSTPFGNTLTLRFAKAAITGYRLGIGEFTDFLTVNCASTDYVGHRFGPNSIEEEDTFLRLDKDLADFFYFLDTQLGEGNYLVFLTADHGAAHSVGFMQAHSLPSGTFKKGAPGDTATSRLKALLSEEFGVTGIIRSMSNYHVNFDLKKIASHHLDFEAIKAKTVDFLRKQPGVQFAVDIDRIGEASIPAVIKTKIVNGYNAKRCGPVIIIPEPGWYDGGKQGTTHGNWNPYDTHLPLVFMGWGIQKGASNREVNITDIAPTLAALLHIQMPNGCIGKPISAVINPK